MTVFTDPVATVDAVAPCATPGEDLVRSIQGFASFCETAMRAGGMPPDDLAMVVAKLREGAFAISLGIDACLDYRTEIAKLRADLDAANARAEKAEAALAEMRAGRHAIRKAAASLVATVLDS